MKKAAHIGPPSEKQCSTPLCGGRFPGCGRRCFHAVEIEQGELTVLFDHRRDHREAKLDPELASSFSPECLTSFGDEAKLIVLRFVRLLMILDDQRLFLRALVKVLEEDAVAFLLVKLHAVTGFNICDPAAIDGKEPTIDLIHLEADGILIAAKAVGCGHHGHTFRQDWVSFDPLKLGRPVEPHCTNDGLERNIYAVVVLKTVEFIATEVDSDYLTHGKTFLVSGPLQRTEDNASAAAFPGVQSEKAPHPPALERGQSTSDVEFQYFKDIRAITHVQRGAYPR